jgi:hypothetical protein
VRSSWQIASGLLCLALAALAARPARADDALRVVVRIASDADRALVPRLRGQLSDLSAQLIVTETAPLEAALEKQLEVARTLAKLQGADAVVWCGSEPSVAAQRRLYIELAQSDRIVSRLLLGAASGVFSSSDLETAALLVRSTLVALSQHVEIGVSADAASGDESHTGAAAASIEGADAQAADGIAADDRADAAVPMPSNLPDEAAASRSGAAPQPSAAAVRERGIDMAQSNTGARPELPAAEALALEHVDHPDLPQAESSKLARAVFQARLMLGAQIALDGQSTSGQRGLSARAGVGFGAWAIDVYGVLSMASTIDDPYFVLNVARHALGVAVERLLPVSDTLSLGLGLHAGALLLRRTSHAQSAAAIDMPPSLTAALALGPELAFSWLPSRFGLSLRFGMDMLPAAPRFEVAGITRQRSTVSHSLWSFEPRITLAWETALP